MKAEELRIGNLINYGDKPTLVDIRMLGLILDDDQDDAFQPIPITSEELLKIGFKDVTDSETKCFEKDGYSITKFRDGDWTVWLSEAHDDPKTVTVKYVHRLQNLMYELK